MHVEETVQLRADKKQREDTGKVPDRISFQGHASSDLLPPTRTCLLKFSLPPKQLKNKHSTHEPVGDISYANHHKGDLGSYQVNFLVTLTSIFPWILSVQKMVGLPQYVK
jgi:hypothetical protein